MTKVRVSKDACLHVPESLSRQLNLTEEDEVELVRAGDRITLRTFRPASSERPLTQLAGLVKSSRPKASVDVAKYMNQKGYEGLHVG